MPELIQQVSAQFHMLMMRLDQMRERQGHIASSISGGPKSGDLVGRQVKTS
jgi:hypothetical protein